MMKGRLAGIIRHLNCRTLPRGPCMTDDDDEHDDHYDHDDDDDHDDHSFDF